MQPQLARACRKLDAAGDADAHRLHAVAALIDALCGEGLHRHLHVVAQGRPLVGVAQGQLHPGGQSVQRNLRLRPPGHPDIGMVSHVLPHAGQVGHHRDAELPQVGRRADARQHQDVGRADGAGAENDLVAFDGEDLAAAFHPSSDSAVAFEQDALHVAVGADGEIEAMARLVQVAQGGAHAHAAGVVEGSRADAGGVGVVVVRAVGKPRLAAGGVECVLCRVPGLRLEAVAHDGAVGAVEIVGEVSVGLQLAEVGQAVGVAPFAVAHFGPRIVVLRHAAQEHLPVDGAGAAGDLAARHHHRRGALGGLADELPVVVADHDVDFSGVAELHLLRQTLEVGIVRPSLQQQHRHRRVFGQPRGDDGAGGTGPNHDVVVLHPGLLNRTQSRNDAKPQRLPLRHCALASWRLDKSVGGLDAFEVGIGGRVVQGHGQISGHVVVDLLQVVRAVAQHDVEQLQHRDLAAVVGRHHALESLAVAAVQEGDDVVAHLEAVPGNLRRGGDGLEPLVLGLHIVPAHAAHLVGQVGDFREGQDVHHRVPQAPGPPGHDGVQLFLAELVVGPHRRAQYRAVLFGQPGGLARQVNRHVQFQGRDELLGVVADDDLGVVDDGHRQRLDAPAAQMLHRSGLAEQVVMFIGNAVGL